MLLIRSCNVLMTPLFIYDYYSLRNIDITEWHDSFFWTVSRSTTTKITIDFVAEQCRLVDELGHTFAGDSLLVGKSLSKTFIQIINHFLSVHRIVEKGYQMVFSDKLKLIPIITGKNKDKMITFEDIWDERSKYPTFNYLSKLIRSVQINFKKSTYSILDHFDRKECIYASSSTSVINRLYTKKNHQWIHITTPDEWLDSKFVESISPQLRNILFNICREFVDFSQKYVSNNFGVELPKYISDGLFDFSKRYLNAIAVAYAAIQKKVRLLKPRHILTATAGKSFTRGLSLAVREEGGKVTGFPHANYICHYSSPRPAFHELATIDEFMAYSPGSVPLIKRNLSMNPPPRNNSVTIANDNTDIFLKQWNMWKSKPLPDKNETVMVMELSFIPEWAGYHAAELMVNYHFYYSICKVLSKNGYNVIFKKRPKSLGWDGFNIFKNLPNVDIVYELFEKPGIIDMVDAVIIQYAMSSTLYWSMCTNKTIIYVDAGWEPWFPDVYDLLEKRCRILHSWYDERNRPCFDEKELLTILETPPEFPNIEFLEKFLFPKY